MCRICAVNFRVRGVLRQMVRSQVCITANHLLRLPTTELLQGEERRAALHVPACPRVAQIVPAKVFDTGAFEREVPSPRADLLDRLTFVGEHVREMLSSLRAHDVHRRVVEWNRNRLSRLRLIRMNPRELE